MSLKRLKPALGFYNLSRNEEGHDAIKFMNSLTPVEFTELWMGLSKFVAAFWNTGRGRKISFNGKDVLLMLLTVLKQNQQCDFTARMLGIKSINLQRVLKNYIKVICDHLWEVLCKLRRKSDPGHDASRNQNPFQSSDYTRSATKATFYQSSLPAENVSEDKEYFFGIHKQ